MTGTIEIESNKSVVRKFLAALGSGDVATIKELISEDIEATCVGTGVMAGTRSYAEVCAATGMLAQMTQNGVDFRILNLTAEADRVACEAEGYSTLTSGKPYNNHYHFLFFIKNGKIVRMREYMDSLLAEKVFGSLEQPGAKFEWNQDLDQAPA
jgi:hypothetical protein